VSCRTHIGASDRSNPGTRRLVPGVEPPLGHSVKDFAMTPLMIAVVVFIAIQAVIGALFFVFNGGEGKVSDRLDAMTGKRKKDDETTNILKKTTMERNKKNLLEILTPNIPSLTKLISQADANIKASTLFGIGALLGVLGT